MKVTARQVATAICKVCKRAGQAYGVKRQQSVKQRVENLLRERPPYGAYVEDGDPYDWGGPNALVTIFMEPKGTDEDCELPLEYYEDGFDVSANASDLLPGTTYIEFVNPAVAVVYPG